jgi:hypothetical protein
MKNIFLLSFTSFILISGFSQSKVNDDEQKIVKLENEWMNAMMRHDLTTLNQIVASTFKLAGIKDLDRPAVSRTTWMMNTMKNLKVDSIHYIKIKVEVTGNIAIVRASFFWKGAFDTEKFLDTTFLVDTWIKRNNKWQVINRLILE